MERQKRREYKVIKLGVIVALGASIIAGGLVAYQAIAARRQERNYRKANLEQLKQARFNKQVKNL